MIREVCVLGFLGLNTWTDLRRKEVSLAASACLGIAALGWIIYKGEISWWLLVPAGVVSMFLSISIMSKGALGMGDCWMVLVLGLTLTVDEFLTVLLTGTLGSAVWGILTYMLRKGRGEKGREDLEIPFVPFLLFGYIGGVLLWE